MVKIKIDSKKCIGCSLCVATLPDNFKLENGKAVVTNSEIKDTSIINTCCVQAISIV